MTISCEPLHFSRTDSCETPADMLNIFDQFVISKPLYKIIANICAGGESSGYNSILLKACFISNVTKIQHFLYHRPIFCQTADYVILYIWEIASMVHLFLLKPNYLKYFESPWCNFLIDYRLWFVRSSRLAVFNFLSVLAMASDPFELIDGTFLSLLK